MTKHMKTTQVLFCFFTHQICKDENVCQPQDNKGVRKQAARVLVKGTRSQARRSRVWRSVSRLNKLKNVAYPLKPQSSPL